MMKSDFQTFDSPTHQRKLHVLHDILEYIFIIMVSLSAIFATLISFSDHIKAYF